MKHGCMVMTLRLSSTRHSGSRQIHRGRKKRVKFAAMPSPCWSFFPRHPRHCPQGIRIPWSKRQWQVLLWGFKAAEGGHSAQTSRQVEEKQLVSPPWQRARSHSTRCSTIPDFQKHYSDSPPFAWPRPLRLFPIPQDEITAERASFWHDWGDPRRNVNGYQHTHIWELSGMHEIMGNTLGSLCTCPRGLLRRRRWKLGVRVRNFFVWSNSPNFWVALCTSSETVFRLRPQRGQISLV